MVDHSSPLLWLEYMQLYAIYWYLHLPCGIFFAVAPTGINLSRSCFCQKKRCCKNVSPRGRVMSPFGRAMSPLQNHIFGIIWKISKNTVPQKKGCSFGNPIFRSKGRNLAPFWRYRYIYIYINMGNIHEYSSHYIPMFVAVPVRQSLINHPPFEVKSRGTSGYEARLAFEINGGFLSHRGTPKSSIWGGFSITNIYKP